ncbi:MAG: hypothetical protein MI920_39180, partial [Kiloniellales bacterium]|nr:hypothetical protein [Kiloniellales bacterium]
NTAGLNQGQVSDLVASFSVVPQNGNINDVTVRIETTTVEAATTAGGGSAGAGDVEVTEADNTDRDTYNLTVTTGSAQNAFVIGSNADDTSDNVTDPHSLDSRRDDVDPPGLSLGNGGPGAILGETGGDLLVGDPGGSAKGSGNFNIALLFDVSASMGTRFSGFAGNGQTRLQFMQDAVNHLLNEFKDHTGVINLKVIPFSRDVPISLPFGDFSDVLSGGADAETNSDVAISFVDSFPANDTTNFEAPMIQAAEFLGGQVLESGGFRNLLFFLTDGGPNTVLSGLHNDQVDVIGTPNDQMNQQAVNAVFENPLVRQMMNGTGVFSGDDGVEIRGIGTGGGLDPQKPIIDQLDNTPVVTRKEDNPFGNGTVIGETQFLKVPDEIEGLPGNEIFDTVGGDLIQGGAGDDLIFGDVPNTDRLAADRGLDPDIFPAGSGWAVFAELIDSQGWTINVGGSFDSNAPDVRAFLENPDSWPQLVGDSRGAGDTIDAGDGDDTVFGQGGGDTITAGAGNDFIDAGAGDDSLFGGAGDDSLIGDAVTGEAAAGPPDFAEDLIALDPVAYYRLGEPSGTVASDEVGGNDGTYLGGVKLDENGVVAGDVDRAAGFDGIDGRVRIADSPDFALLAGTIQFWFNASAIDGKHVLLSRVDGPLAQRGEFLIRLREAGNDTANLELNIPAGRDPDFASVAVTEGGDGAVKLGTWNHVAFTWDTNGDGVAFYLNGARIGFDKRSIFNLTNGDPDLLIGGQQSGEDAFAGRIDEVAIFGRALSLQEINQIIDNAEAGPSQPPADAAFRGDDLIEAGLGSDTLIGGQGDDILDAGIDVDIDTFVFNLGANDGADILRNFDEAMDVLKFENVLDVDGDGVDLGDLDAAIATIDDGPADLVIRFDNGAQITLEGAGEGTGLQTSVTDLINETQIDVS